MNSAKIERVCTLLQDLTLEETTEVLREIAEIMPSEPYEIFIVEEFKRLDLNPNLVDETDG